MDCPGIMLQVGGALECHVRLRFACFICDCKGLWEIVSAKGASGSKPCFECVNEYGRADAGLDLDHMVHSPEADDRKFDHCDPATSTEMADVLAAAVGVLDNDAFDLLQQTFGMKYDSKGLPWDLEMREVAQLPDCIFWDSQHCLYSSSGVFQFQTNGFIWALKDRGITTADLDTFTSTVTLPRSHERMKNDFFTRRGGEKGRSISRALRRRCPMHFQSVAYLLTQC